MDRRWGRLGSGGENGPAAGRIPPLRDVWRSLSGSLRRKEPEGLRRPGAVGGSALLMSRVTVKLP